MWCWVVERHTAWRLETRSATGRQECVNLTVENTVRVQCGGCRAATNVVPCRAYMFAVDEAGKCRFAPLEWRKNSLDHVSKVVVLTAASEFDDCMCPPPTFTYHRRALVKLGAHCALYSRCGTDAKKVIEIRIKEGNIGKPRAVKGAGFSPL